MAVTVINDASVTVNAVDLSDHVKRVSVTRTFNEVDVSAMGDTDAQRLPGLGDGEITVTFLQDYASASVDATLWPLVGDGTGFTVVVKPDSGAVSVSNPSFTATCHLYDYTAIDAEVGTVTEVPVTMKTSGAITRATA